MTEKNVLIWCLARVDAIFSPVHETRGHFDANRTTLRQQYDERGIPLPVGGDAAERKRVERALAALAAAELVEVFRTAGGSRSASVRLTDSGDTEARKLCGLPTVASLPAFLQHVADLVSGPAAYCWGGRELVALDDVAEISDPAAPDAASERQKAIDFALPALVRGYLAPDTSTTGRHFLSVTDSGRDFLAAHVDDGERDTFKPAKRAWADLYDGQFMRSITWLRGMPPIDPAEMGTIPVPHALMPRGIARERGRDPFGVNDGMTIRRRPAIAGVDAGERGAAETSETPDESCDASCAI